MDVEVTENNSLSTTCHYVQYGNVPSSVSAWGVAPDVVVVVVVVEVIVVVDDAMVVVSSEAVAVVVVPSSYVVPH